LRGSSSKALKKGVTLSGIFDSCTRLDRSRIIRSKKRLELLLTLKRIVAEGSPGFKQAARRVGRFINVVASQDNEQACGAKVNEGGRAGNFQLGAYKRLESALVFRPNTESVERTFRELNTAS